MLIDEVQYAPQLFSYIKIAVDRGAAPGSFWMAGSQTFRLMELVQESLAGRTAILQMSSLSQHEIYGSGENTPFEISIEALRARTLTCCKTDTRGMYERIWRGSMPGSVSGKFPNRDTFYSNNLLKRTIKTPKMYFFDTGLVVYLTKYSSPDILMNGAINGAILENYTVAETMKSYTGDGCDSLHERRTVRG